MCEAPTEEPPNIRGLMKEHPPKPARAKVLNSFDKLDPREQRGGTQVTRVDDLIPVAPFPLIQLHNTRRVRSPAIGCPPMRGEIQSINEICVDLKNSIQ